MMIDMMPILRHPQIQRLIIDAHSHVYRVLIRVVGDGVHSEVQQEEFLFRFVQEVFHSGRHAVDQHAVVVVPTDNREIFAVFESVEHLHLVARLNMPDGATRITA